MVQALNKKKKKNDLLRIKMYYIFKVNNKSNEFYMKPTE